VTIPVLLEREESAQLKPIERLLEEDTDARKEMEEQLRSPVATALREAVKGDLFDFKETMARMDGDWELFREVVGLFATDSRVMMEQIGAAVAAGDSRRLQRAAHTLKGAISNFGARVPQDLALKLETLGKNGELAGAEAGCADLARELELLRDALVTCAGRTRA
jgi:HPt (histidine-containing phosphotransfer) domain-containing protein